MVGKLNKKRRKDTSEEAKALYEDGNSLPAA